MKTVSNGRDAKEPKKRAEGSKDSMAVIRRQALNLALSMVQLLQASREAYSLGVSWKVDWGETTVESVVKV